MSAPSRASGQTGRRADLSAGALAEAAHAAADLFIEIERGWEQRRVHPPIRRDDLRDLFEGSIPERGIGVGRAVEDFRKRVVPNCLGIPHPLYWGLVNCSPLPGASLADTLVSALNNNSGAYGQSPAATAAEAEIVRVFARAFFGTRDDEVGGMLLPGGTYANLQALAIARQRHFPEVSDSGLSALSQRPVLYTSEAAHFSVERAAAVLGLGRANVTNVPTRGRGELDPDALAESVASDRSAGARPFAVVATTGTTPTGAIDPVAAVAEVCRQDNLWLHVDACYGGGAVLLDEMRDRLAGIERADSIAVDIHKWFFAPLTASLLLVHEPAECVATFDVDASYIPHRDPDEAFRNGVPTSRRATSLTLWMALRAHGIATVRDAVKRTIALTRHLEQGLSAAGFTVLPDGELSIACARWEPRDVAPDRLDALQDEIADRVRRSGRAWFSTVRHRERTWLRFNLVNLHTREHHVDEMVEILKHNVRELTR